MRCGSCRAGPHRTRLRHRGPARRAGVRRRGWYHPGGRGDHGPTGRGGRSRCHSRVGYLLGWLRGGLHRRAAALAGRPVRRICPYRPPGRGRAGHRGGPARSTLRGAPDRRRRMRLRGNGTPTSRRPGPASAPGRRPTRTGASLHQLLRLRGPQLLERPTGVRGQQSARPLRRTSPWAGLAGTPCGGGRRRTSRHGVCPGSGRTRPPGEPGGTGAPVGWHGPVLGPDHPSQR